MSNSILTRKHLNLYNYVKLKNIVIDIFELFKYLERSNDKVIVPKITNDYRVRYEQFIPVRSSIVEKYALKSLMLESKSEETRKELLSKITIALRKLNDLEAKVFYLTHYQDVGEEEIIEAIAYGKDKAREIKKSAYIKFLSSLGLDSFCFK